MANVMQDTYGTKVLERLKKESVFRGLVNDTYEGTPTLGGTVRIVKVGDVTAADYNKTTGLSATESDTSFVDILINKDKAVNIRVDGSYENGLPVSVTAAYMAQAADAFASSEDLAIVAEMVANGTVSTKTSAVTKDTIYADILAEVTEMNKSNVSKKDRYIAVQPEVLAYLLESDKVVKGSDMGQKYIEEGFIAKIAGCYVKDSTDLAEDVPFVIWSKAQGVGFAEGFTVAPKVVDLEQSDSYIGAKAVKGRMCFGAKVLEAKAVRIRKVV